MSKNQELFKFGNKLDQARERARHLSLVQAALDVEIAEHKEALSRLEKEYVVVYKELYSSTQLVKKLEEEGNHEKV